MPGIPWTGKWTWEASDSSDDGETYAQALSSSSSRKRVARSRAGVLPARFRDSSFELPLHKVLDGGAARLQPPHKKPKSDHTSSRPTKRRSSSPTKNNFKPKTNTAAASRRSTSAASSSKPHSLYRIEEDFIYGSIDVDDEEEDDDADEASDTFAAPSVSSSDVELPRDSQFERGSPASSSLTPDMASTWLSALCTDPLMCMFAADGKPRKVTTLERISFAERVRRARARCTWATQQDKTVYWLRARTMDMRNVYIAIRDQLSPIGACTAVCIWPQDSPDRQLLAQLMQIHSAPWWPKWHDDVATKYRNLQVKTEDDEAGLSLSSDAPMSSAYAALLQISGPQGVASTSSLALPGLAPSPPEADEHGGPVTPEQQALHEARRLRVAQKQEELNRQLQLELELLRTHHETQRTAIEQEYARHQRAPTPDLGSSDEPATPDAAWSVKAEQPDSTHTAASRLSAGTEVDVCALSGSTQLRRLPPPPWLAQPQSHSHEDGTHAHAASFEAWINTLNDAAAAASQQAEMSTAAAAAPQRSHSPDAAAHSDTSLGDIARHLVAARQPASAASGPLADELLGLDCTRNLEALDSLRQAALLAQQLADAAEASQEPSSSFGAAASQTPDLELDFEQQQPSSQDSLATLQFGTDAFDFVPAAGTGAASLGYEDEEATESQLAVLRLLSELGKESGAEDGVAEAGPSTLLGSLQ